MTCCHQKISTSKKFYHKNLHDFTGIYSYGGKLKALSHNKKRFSIFMKNLDILSPEFMVLKQNLATYRFIYSNIAWIEHRLASDIDRRFYF